MTTDHVTYRSAARVALVTGVVLLVPLLAMRFTDEVVWTLTDFVAAGALLLGTGLVYEMAARRAEATDYRAAAGLALAAALLIVWIDLAVGIVGEPGGPASAAYLGVVAVGVAGSIIARFRARGMSRAMFATAIALAVAAAVALLTGSGAPATPQWGVLTLNAIFVSLLVASGVLFLRAAGAEPAGDRTPPG